MPTPEIRLTLTVPLLVEATVSDWGGYWQYAGTTAVTGDTPPITVSLMAAKRVNQSALFHPTVTTLTATVIYPAASGQVAQNLTLQGVHDMTTNNETGSVSAASPEFAAYIGGTFVFDAATLLLVISPAAAG